MNTGWKATISEDALPEELRTFVEWIRKEKRETRIETYKQVIIDLQHARQSKTISRTIKYYERKIKDL